MTTRLLEQAELVYPPAAVDMELDQMLENIKQQAQRSGWQWEDYLTMQGLDESDIRDQFRETAVEQLRNRLVLRQLILDEKITVEAEDIDAAVEDRVSKFDNPELRDSMRDYFRQGEGFDAISGQILQNKVYERIKAIFSGEAPDLSELEEETDESDTTDEEE
jgi:trigger factor